MTGLTDIQPVITPKRLEILKETVPQATRFGILWSPTAPSYRSVLDAAEATKGKLGVQFATVGVSTVAEFDGAFARMAQQRVDGVFVASSVLTARHNPPLLAQVALKHRLPTMFGARVNVVAGGLMSYAPDQWRQLNLLSNALKFTPEGGRIDVRASVSDGMAGISVVDTGVGIAPEDQEAVFEEFRQVGTASKKVEGTGLGLALSRKFIELHGGRIWVKSQVGVGSTFTFTLPVRQGE